MASLGVLGVYSSRLECLFKLNNLFADLLNTNSLVKTTVEFKGFLIFVEEFVEKEALHGLFHLEGVIKSGRETKT